MRKRPPSDKIARRVVRRKPRPFLDEGEEDEREVEIGGGPPPEAKDGLSASSAKND